MAQVVVDFLELVQVQHEQGLALTWGFGQARIALGVQSPTVRQAGQLVGGGIQTAQVSHPGHQAKRQLGARACRQQRHAGQRHRQNRQRYPATHEQHTQTGGSGHCRHHKGHRPAHRSRFHLLGRSVGLCSTVDPQCDHGKPDGPGKVKQRTDRICVPGHL